MFIYAEFLCKKLRARLELIGSSLVISSMDGSFVKVTSILLSILDAVALESFLLPKFEAAVTYALELRLLSIAALVA